MILIKGKVLKKRELSEKISLIELLGKNGSGYEVYKIRYFMSEPDVVNSFNDIKEGVDATIPVMLTIYKDKIQYTYNGE